MKNKFVDLKYRIINFYSSIPFTLTEMIVVLIAVVLLFSCNTSYAKQKNVSVMVTNLTENRILYSQNSIQIRPMASLTKLMTAMIALDYDSNMNRKMIMKNREYTRGELLHMLLIRSNNTAAETLASEYPGGRSSFIRDMNIQATMLAMYDTYFDDPSGLSKNNVSTASNITQMLVAAAKYREIRDISVKKTTAVEAQGKRKNRILLMHNTNTVILSQVNGIKVSKTGYTNPAGYCVAIVIEKHSGYHEAVVVMGARNSSQRVDTVKRVVYNKRYD